MMEDRSARFSVPKRLSRTTLERIEDLRTQLDALVAEGRAQRDARRARVQAFEASLLRRDRRGGLSLSTALCAALLFVSVVALQSGQVVQPLVATAHTSEVAEAALEATAPFAPGAVKPASPGPWTNGAFDAPAEPPTHPTERELADVADPAATEAEAKRLGTTTTPAPRTLRRGTTATHRGAAANASDVPARATPIEDDPLAGIENCGDDPICGL